MEAVSVDAADVCSMGDSVVQALICDLRELTA